MSKLHIQWSDTETERLHKNKIEIIRSKFKLHLKMDRNQVSKWHERQLQKPHNQT